MKTKNIVFLCASLAKGGAERVVSLLLKEYAKRENIQVHLIMMQEGIDYDIPKNITITTLYKQEKNNVVKLLELPLVAFRLRAYIKRHNIDTVISFLYRPNYVNIIAKLMGSKHRTIINIRSTTSRYLEEGFSGKVNLFLIDKLFDKADIIISNSHGVDEDLKSLTKITTLTKVIHNPIDLELINAKKDVCEDTPFVFKPQKKYIISLGRLIKLKRNHDLIDAFHNLHQTHENVEILFLGDGDLRETLLTYVHSLGLSKKIHFLGNVGNPFYYLNKSDIFVLNSQTEGFPNVLLEALSVGLKVISSNCKSGPVEILENGEYGLLYPVGDVNILTNLLKNLLNTESDNAISSKKAIKRSEIFKLENIIKQFDEVV